MCFVCIRDEQTAVARTPMCLIDDTQLMRLSAGTTMLFPTFKS